MNKYSIEIVKGVKIVDLAGGLKKIEEAEVTLVSFGSLSKVPVDQITPRLAIRAYDEARNAIDALRKGMSEEVPYPSVAARIAELKADMDKWVRLTDAIVAKSTACGGTVNMETGTDEMPF